MASGNGTQSGTTTATIERYFQVSLYLLVLTGLGTLASTGTLDAPTVVLVGMALLVRGYLLNKRSDLQIPTRWTNYLTLAYTVFYVVDYRLLSGGFLSATVHLVLFGMVIRLFSVQKDRDHYMLAVLSFLMVLAAAVLTVDSVFLFAFSGFMLTAVAAFVLMEMRRSAQTATIPARESKDPLLPRKMAFFLAGATPVLVAMILVSGFAIFFLLPRMSAGYLGSFAGGSDVATGFSDRVQLGRIGQIQQSSSVVMHVQIEGDTRGAYDLKWRGVALGVFDGRTWSNPSEQYVLPRGADGRYALWQTAGLQDTRLIHYRVLMEPIGTNVFFFAPKPRYLSGVYREVASDRAGSIYNLDPEHPVSLYEADSELVTPSVEQLRKAADTYPPEMELSYLELPPLDARIPLLAKHVTSEAGNNYDRAVAIEHYLRKNFAYTLQLPRIPPKDPLADFLFVRKQGHCEYFASSMAILLRTLRIPARVVNGFRTSEFNDLTGNYVIRARNAHSWVEAYFAGYGWSSFDPTPGGGLTATGGWGRMLLYADAMGSFWREWVVNYDASHQKALGQDAIRGSRSVVEQVRGWAQREYAAALAAARHMQRRIKESPRRWIFLGILLGVLLSVGANVRGLLRWLRERHLRAHPQEAPVEAAALWYQQMLMWVGRHGWQKTSVQTPAEFVREIEDPRMRQCVEKFTRAYEAARFGESSDEARLLPGLYEEITTPDRG
jgi:transglutaminase-like putative cysteine protease